MATTLSTDINTVDAIWCIIQSQSASVRKAIKKRLIDAEIEAKTRRQQKMVKVSLTRAFEELAEAKHSGRQLPDAHSLFK